MSNHMSKTEGYPYCFKEMGFAGNHTQSVPVVGAFPYCVGRGPALVKEFSLKRVRR